jgi:signal transduction histidine kinase
MQSEMRIPLHVKTTILASIVIISVMAITVAFFTTKIVDRLQKEQRDFAEAQAESLTEKVADSLPGNDYDRVRRLVAVFDQARVRKDEEDEIRIWELNGTDFYKRVETAKKESITELPVSGKSALIAGKEVKIEEVISSQRVYRVFVPIVFDKTVVGAVEFAEQLDTFSSLAQRYLLTGIWLAFTFIIATAFVIYFLTRYFIYQPLNKISSAMSHAKAGELTARTEISGKDEFGILGSELNRMLAEIEEFSTEREKRNELLAERVKDATSELKTRNEQLEYANIEIWQATNRLFQFEKLAAAGQTAAQFAHEVGTPLNLISGHIQLLQKQIAGDAPLEKRLDIIGSQIERIEGIVRSMLDKTRFGEVVQAPLDVNAVLREVSEIIFPKLESEKIKMTLQLIENLPPIKGNTERLQQVFLNLINNANDAMADGGELKIATKSEENSVIVEISDTGLGIDEETKAHIFEPLFTTKTRGRGTGLGLVIVRQILSEHHAQIGVESEKNVGTSFRIRFPAIS